MVASEFVVVRLPQGGSAYGVPSLSGSHLGNGGWQSVPQLVLPTCCSLVRGVLGRAQLDEAVGGVVGLDVGGLVNVVVIETAGSDDASSAIDVPGLKLGDIDGLDSIDSNGRSTS